MKRTTNKLIVSSLALAFAAATTISTSYAWFTMQTTATVTQIDVNVTTGEGFEIKFVGVGGGATGDGDYKQTLSITDFNEAYDGVLANLYLNHVTTGTGVDGFQTWDVDNAEFDNAVANSHYLEFAIDFRGRSNYTIFLDQARTYAWSTGKAFVANSALAGSNRYSTDDIVASLADFQNATVRSKDATIVEGGNIVAFSADAARMSIEDVTAGITGVVGYTSESDKVLALTQGGYGEAVTGPTNLALTYYNSVVTTPLEFPDGDPHTVPSATSSIAEIADKGANDELLVLTSIGDDSGFFYGRLTFRVWLEGWDGDCFNAIFNDILHFGLGFDGDVVA